MKEREVSILAIGDELVSGKTQDRNSAYAAQLLGALGVQVSEIRLVPDRHSAIVEALQSLSEKAQLIICCGGLGPTDDDLTRQAVAEFVEQPLERMAQCEQKLRGFLEARGRTLTATNERQLYLPRTSEILENLRGTADAFVVSFAAGKQILTLPGVPSEFTALLDTHLPRICASLFGPRNSENEAVLQVFGVPESDIGMRIEALQLDAAVRVAYRPHFPIVSVELFADDRALLETAEREVAAAIGTDCVFARGRGVTLAASLGQLLVARKHTIAVAESCTGGLVGHHLVSEAGSSSYFLGGIIAYANTAKSSLLSVQEEILETHGAVSAEVAMAMARGAREALQSNIALSVTGIAGPDGGSADKPVGTVYLGYADSSGASAAHYLFIGSRDAVRTLSAYSALDTVRRKILKLPELSLYAGKISKK